MALTDTQKAAVRLYLGYPDGSRGGPGDLERAMDGLSAAGQTVVEGLLTSLAAIDTKLSSSWDRQKVTRAEEITFAGPEELRALRGEGGRVASRLAAALGVPIASNPFAMQGSPSGVARRGA